MDDNFSIKRQNIRTLSLVVFTLIYLLTGAAVFDTLESNTEERNKDNLLTNINRFRQHVNMSDDEFESLYKHMIKKGNYNRNPQWDFGGSFYFCTLTLALIGYGHSTPNTNYGKIFCIFYTLCGIPISLIMFQSSGERLNGFLRYLMIKIKSSNNFLYSFKNKNVSNKDLIILDFILTGVLVLSASYVFSVFEEWTYFDSLYYSFITLTTIGFGDYVPLQKNNYLKKYPMYVAFTILFIIVGLTILASSTNLLVLYLVNINSEENLRKRMRLKQKKREQKHKMLIGDVILAVNKQDVVTYMDEMPNLAALTEEISVCSCDDVRYCYVTYVKKLKKDTQFFMSQINLRKRFIISKKRNKHFTVKRQPTKITHLYRHYDKSDYILKFMDKTEMSIRRLAYESDFISSKKINHRNSI